MFPEEFVLVLLLVVSDDFSELFSVARSDAVSDGVCAVTSDELLSELSLSVLSFIVIWIVASAELT